MALDARPGMAETSEVEDHGNDLVLTKMIEHCRTLCGCCLVDRSVERVVGTADDNSNAK